MFSDDLKTCFFPIGCWKGSWKFEGHAWSIFSQTSGFSKVSSPPLPKTFNEKILEERILLVMGTMMYEAIECFFLKKEKCNTDAGAPCDNIILWNVKNLLILLYSYVSFSEHEYNQW